MTCKDNGREREGKQQPIGRLDRSSHQERARKSLNVIVKTRVEPKLESDKAAIVSSSDPAASKCWSLELSAFRLEREFGL